MHSERVVSPARLRRLAEELEEAGVSLGRWIRDSGALLDELDYALRPPVHERRIPTYGCLVLPAVAPSEWGGPTGLEVTARANTRWRDDDARRFADGLASWVVRGEERIETLAVFDRAAGSERDLVVLAAATESTIVQRHPAGMVRMVGAPGVARWDGMTWHQEPPVGLWIDATGSCVDDEQRATFTRLLTFAVHDLGARGIGALLVLRSSAPSAPRWEARMESPPPLRIDRPFDLAPLRHVLSQLDGAAVFDSSGALEALGVRLIPSPEAENGVDPLRGTRHTAARRYSYDDSEAIVIAVSEDGPVTVLRRGELIGRSVPLPDQPLLVPADVEDPGA